LRSTFGQSDLMLQSKWQRWLFMLVVFAAASAFNFSLQPELSGRVPFLPYFPALVLVGMCAGLGPGIVLMLLADLMVQIYWVEPYGVIWPIAKTGDTLTILMFLVAGAFVLACAAWARELVRAARESKDLLEMALGAGKMATWRYDVESGAVTFSAGSREVLGLEVLPKTLTEGWPKLHSEDRARTQVNIEAAIASSGTFKELTRIGESDPAKWVETHGRVVQPLGEEPRHVTAVIVDVTERQEALLASQAAEQRLLEDARRKDSFLATLAHELRNPMAPIRYAVAMLGDNATPAQRQKAKDVITRQASHMARLLDDLLDMSRITRNAIELRRAVVDLREVTRAAVENVRPVAQQGRQRLETSETGESVFVDGDATRLQQVVGNLLDNALKFTEAGGEVSVRVDSEAGEAVIRVSDSGLGIDPKSQNEIFELFTQVRQPGEGKGGLGIGLAVVKQLVELHGGSVRVDSEGLGHGSQFEIRLPRVEQRPASNVPGATNVISLMDSPRVLVVDDNVDTADMLAMCVRENGYAASIAYTGSDALNAFQTLQPDIVLLDLGLPDLHGTEVARRIRGLPGGRSAQLVAITGWGQEKDRQLTAAAGFNMHLVKPVDPQKLLEQLRQVQGAQRIH
jgi:signal transduction histidine kinase/CheY-like chemotaxis protein